MVSTHSISSTSWRRLPCLRSTSGWLRRLPQARTITARWKTRLCEGSGPSYISTTPARIFPGTNIVHRGDLTPAQREEYTTAVQCLMKLPAQAPKKKYPGALSRFDDFVAYHITHASTLHDTIHIFPAHKQFLYVYEQALRTECGYTGYQPVR
jgi:Common central domain of tyrosinase